MPTAATFVGGSAVLFLACFVSSAGGIGGGGLVVPILLLIFGYSFDYAVSLSLCVVLGNTLAQFFLNVQQHHPVRKSQPLIWLELVIVLSPAQLGGSNLGSYLSKILPESELYILAFLILCFATIITVRKGLRKRRDEIHADQAAAEQQQRASVTASPLVGDPETSMSILTNVEFNDQGAGGNSLRIEWPVSVITAIVVMWCGYLTFSVARSQVEVCSDEYISMFALCYVPLAAGLVWGVWHNRHRLKAAPDAPDQAILTSRDSLGQLDAVEQHLFVDHSLVLPTVTFCIGVVCSLLGIGGGEIISPMMLHYGVPPTITSATSACLGLLNTLALVIRALAAQDFNPETGLILFVMGLVGGLSGRKFGLFFAATYNRASVIIFALSGALSLSAGYYLYKLAFGDFDSSFSSPCE